jgi:hypothetical protein
VIRRPWNWLARHPWVTSLIMVAVFAAAAGWRDVVRERGQVSYDNCVSQWAEQVTARSSAISKASDELWRTMARILRDTAGGDPNAARADFITHLDAYIRASNDHPVPQALALKCTR